MELYKKVRPVMRERVIRSFFLPLLQVALAAILFCPSHCRAQDNPQDNPNNDNSNAAPMTDAEGCSDIPVFPKLPGSIITSCQTDKFVEVIMPLSPDAQGYSREARPHGPYEFRSYDILQTDQQDQAFDNLVDLLGIAGFKIKYKDSPGTITARREDIWILLQISGDSYTASAVQSKEEPWTPIKDTAGIAHEIESRYRAAIYGIQFSPEDQMVVTENSRILNEVLKYLKANPKLAVTVEAHKMTEGGNEKDDLEITKKRAEAVVAWLVANGISGGRLQPKGVGRTKPLTENDTDQEIQQNERIELVTIGSPNPKGN